jgi:hypothetical protein
MSFNIRTKAGLYKFFRELYPDRSMANDVKDILVNYTKKNPEMTSKDLEKIIDKIVDNSRLRKSPIARKEDLQGIINIEQKSPKQKSKKRSSKIKSKGISPKRKSKTKSPKIKSKTKSPKRKSKTKSPKRKSKTKSPKIKSKTKSPKIKSKTKSPKSKSKKKSKSKSPKRKSKSKTPKLKKKKGENADKRNIIIQHLILHTTDRIPDKIFDSFMKESSKKEINKTIQEAVGYDIFLKQLFEYLSPKEIDEVLQITDNFGRTLLMLAVDKESRMSIKRLIKMGANINAKAKNGDTALKIARRGDDETIENILIEAGANE